MMITFWNFLDVCESAAGGAQDLLILEHGHSDLPRTSEMPACMYLSHFWYPHFLVGTVPPPSCDEHILPGKAETGLKLMLEEEMVPHNPWDCDLC